MTASLLLVITLVFLAVFVNGWTDAPNAITTVITTRVLRPGVAIVMATVFNFLGAILSGTAVAAATSRIVDFESGASGLIAIAAAMVALIVWAVSAWALGIPTSETHALVAGLMGAGLAMEGVAALNSSAIMLVVYGIIFSALLGFALSYILTVVVKRLALMKNASRSEVNRFSSGGQILACALFSLAHGAQDGQKFMGVMFVALVLGKQVQTPDGLAWNLPFEVLVGVALVLAFGTSFGAYRIVKNLGMEMVQLKKYQGFAADLAASLSLLLATGIGIPLSTTHTKASALMGAAASEGIRKVKWPVANQILLAWVLTFPACLVLSFVFAKIMNNFI